MAMYKNIKIIGKGGEDEHQQTLVLSHGFGASQVIWDSILPFLQERYHQVVLFDWEFSSEAIHPSSYTYENLSGAVISLLDELKLKEVVFVGHSMAGLISCIASIRRPDLFAHLVMVGASPRYFNSDDYKGGFQISDIDTMLSQITSNYTVWAESMVSQIVGIDDPVSVEKLSRSYLTMRPEVAHYLASDIFLKDRRHVLEKVETPCTIIGTSEDFAVPVEVSQYMQSRIKGGMSALEIIEAEGHCPFMTAHSKFMEVFDRIILPKMAVKDSKLDQAVEINNGGINVMAS